MEPKSVFPTATSVESWHSMSRELEEISHKEDGGNAEAAVDEDEEPWIDLPPLIDGTSSIVSSSLREFMTGIGDTKGALPSRSIGDPVYINSEHQIAHEGK